MTVESFNRFMAYNTKIKRFPGSNSIQVKTYSWTIDEEQKQPIKPDTPKVYDDVRKAQKKAILSEKSSLRRTQNAVYDIARANEKSWEWFVTITFNPEKVNSFDYDEVTKKVTNYFNRMRKSNPNMIYLGVPEKHKSGRYHFHFLMGQCEKLEMTDSGHKTKNGQPIYNIGSYRLGFSTATRIENKARCTSYICKYITKDLYEHTKNKKRYPYV